ncbi:hypothetical protein ALC53_07990, partial [Atta colombica]
IYNTSVSSKVIFYFRHSIFLQYFSSAWNPRLPNLSRSFHFCNNQTYSNPHMAAFLTLSSSRTIALADYFPTGQQLFSSVASLQHPPCSSFVPEQHLAPQHPPFFFLCIYSVEL